MALIEGMEALARTVARSRARDKTPRLMWGQVDAAGRPATVVLDGDQSGTPRPVSGSAVGLVAAGQRVLLARQGRRLWIVNAPEFSQLAVLTLAAGWSHPSGFPVQVRRRGPVVQLEGLLTPPSDAATQDIATIPTWARPVAGLRFTTHALTNRAVGALQVSSSGVLQFNTAWWPTLPSGWLHIHTTWLAAD